MACALVVALPGWGCIRYLSPGRADVAPDEPGSDAASDRSSRELPADASRAEASRDRARRDGTLEADTRAGLDGRIDLSPVKDLKPVLDHRPGDLAKPDLARSDLPSCDDKVLCTADSWTSSGCQNLYETGPCLDQACVPIMNSAVLINSAITRFVAQGFTAGKTGTLLGVNLAISAYTGGGYPLHVALRDAATDGSPGNKTLAETTLANPVVPLTQLVTFTKAPAIVAGTKYALVVDQPTAPVGTGVGWGCGTNYAATCPGNSWRTGDGITWDAAFNMSDMVFRLYVTP